MFNPALEFCDRHGGAELEDLDVLGFHERFERLEMDAAGAGGAVVAGRGLHVVDVESGQAVLRGIRAAGRG